RFSLAAKPRELSEHPSCPLYPLCPWRLSVPHHSTEVQPLQRERPRVGLDDVPHVERAVACLGADVAVDVHGAVDVEIDVVTGEAAVDAVGELEQGELAGDRHTRHDIHAADA